MFLRLPKSDLQDTAPAWDQEIVLLHSATGTQNINIINLLHSIQNMLVPLLGLHQSCKEITNKNCKFRGLSSSVRLLVLTELEI